MQLPAWLQPYSESWERFVEMRKAMKRVPFTDYAQKLIINDLEEFHQEGLDVGWILNKSIKNGWRGVFSEGAPRIAQQTHREPSQKLLGIVQGLKEHYAKKAAEKGRVA